MREGATNAVAEERSGGGHLGYRNRVGISAETIVRRRSDVITESVLDDVVVLDPATSRYVRLNTSSATLWQALAGSPATIESLGHLLEERHAAPSERAVSDALAFVEAMSRRGLVELSGPV